MKLAIISDIHYGPLHHSTNHPGYIRQASEQALSALKTLILQFNQLRPDAVIQLGDLIIPNNHDDDIERITQIISVLSQSTVPVYSLLGNHDLDNLTLDEYLDITQKYPLNQGMVGNFSIDNWEFWWLNHRHHNTGDYIADSELDKIRNSPSHSTYRCILTHYPLITPDVADSFYFGNHPQKARLTNDDLDFLWENQPSLLLNGHLHFYSHIHQGRTHAITLQPFSENLQTKKYAAVHPQTHTLINIDHTLIEITTYTGNFVLSRDSFNLIG